MEQITPSRRIVRFGGFELDLSAGELRKNGRRLKLQEQPLQVLASLVERPGQVVTRKELRQRLWAADTYVDFDRGLNSAVNRLREALDDSAQQPRFIETLPRRGYRFIGLLEPSDDSGNLVALGSATSTEPGRSTESALVERLRRARLQLRLLLVSLILAIGVIVALWFRSTSPTPNAPLRKFGLPVRSTEREVEVGPKISPDGRRIVFADRLDHGWGVRIQDLALGELSEIGSDDARRPFWSPDSRFIAFAAGSELKRIPVDGGTSISICHLPSTVFSGGTWSPDGRSIVISSGHPPRLYEVPANGGTPGLLFEPEDSAQHKVSFIQPHFLPVAGRQRVLLFTRVKRIKQLPQHEVVVRNLDTGNQEEVAVGMNATYSPTGHIVYRQTVWPGNRPSALWAIPFSLRRLRTTGQAFQIKSAIGLNPSVARDGTLVYLEYIQTAQYQLVWRGRSGKKLREIGQPQPNIAQLSLSPDGATVAVSGEDFGWDVWLQDTERNIKNRLTFDPIIEGAPVWSPQGDRVAFLARRPQTDVDILIKDADGSGDSEVLVASNQAELPTDWSSDGRYLVFERLTSLHDSESSSTPSDLWYLEFENNGSDYQEHPFTHTTFDESRGKLSPDSRFLAYSSDESGRNEVYVQPFPEGGAKYRVSRNGGTQPLWSRDGRELFYVEDDTLIAVAVKTAPTFSCGPSSPLFKDPMLKFGAPGHAYDVSSDSLKFVLRERPKTNDLVIRMVQNWFKEFRDQQ